NNYVTINNLVFDGKHSATVDIRSPNIPAVNFPGYRNEPASVPALPQYQLPTINTNGDDAKVPVMYKANISYSHYFTAKLKLSLSGYMTLGRNNYMYVDRNMVANPFFTLKEEGDRGVYVPLNTMPSNGAGDWLQGRVSNRLGRVLELNSKGKVNQFAIVVDGTWQYFRDGEISASYTWNDARDNTSFNGNVANTATLSLPVRDDPRNLSLISYSDNMFRHKVVVYGTLPTFYGITVGVRYSGIGGTRYSLLSGANSNADFVAGNNDLAYIFDRNKTTVPQNVRDGLTAILNNPNASQSIKDYINKYSGGIAERNGGINEFYGIIDLRISKKFRLHKTHNIEISGDLFNVANMLKRTWGANKSLGSQALYGTGIPAANGNPAQPNFDVVNARYN
ncbi:MAG: TonB-dependent receptor, partial [Sphingobacteriales bacterium]